VSSDSLGYFQAAAVFEEVGDSGRSERVRGVVPENSWAFQSPLGHFSYGTPGHRPCAELLHPAASGRKENSAWLVA
jgi:hypothetical protein